MADTNLPGVGHSLSPASHDGPEVRHEESDVNVIGVLAFAAGLFVAAVLIHFMVWLLFLYFSGREAARVPSEYPLAAGQETRVPPEPRLQTHPREDLQALRAREDAVLHSYGWVDKTAGIVRIPIDEAIKLTAQRGLPVREGNGGTRK
jgi:hypothetical protein